ncbi:hypothetical protein RUM44_008645 [Polyplax serrata]|uniref:Uncharacterized protein n=1 Tax=Polyplax serrata TaxID=468196 RepID=A0ABR1BCT7_POLSC
MINTCGVVTRGSKNSEISNACPPSKRHPSNPWKIVFGLEDPDRGSVTQHVKKTKPIGNKRGGQESTGLDDGHLLGLEPTLKRIMKQLSNIKRKFTQGKRSGDAVVGKHQQQSQQQNGQQLRRKVKRPLGKKPPSTETPVKNKLNVNERPVRKKKKTKKYESYERNGKSPEPEIKHETNLLLALGLTPVKKEAEDSEKSK